MGSVDITAAPVPHPPLFARLCRDNEDVANRNGRSTVGRGSCFSILAKIAYGAFELAPISPFASPDRELTCSPP